MCEVGAGGSSWLLTAFNYIGCSQVLCRCRQQLVQAVLGNTSLANQERRKGEACTATRCTFQVLIPLCMTVCRMDAMSMYCNGG